MPIEASLLKDAVIEAEQCPRCGHHPLDPFMRGLVHRRKWGFSFEWPLLVQFHANRPYCAVICDNCKEIIAWEEPSKADYERCSQHESEPMVFYVDEHGRCKVEQEIHAAAVKRSRVKLDDASASSMMNSSVSSAFHEYGRENKK